jgi:hypothetical protein
VSLSQNSVSFGKGSGKSGLKPAFSHKSKVDFPKLKFLEILLFKEVLAGAVKDYRGFILR